ncbi:methylamine utilization protein MauE [Antricoccus suffuscus]|uniref:Methylamine utilization protein MauE n=1 Tax=Antricoccus suffuscus TaxID=1629062 RepID=A0A2T1A2W5_9ACTN|nr:MauE/DoxX family redox-associated membrane protein [Antricoccus suffuscus]PRZ42952.1 methylamine utilization protein MauE [Antricoccus suffuscus]
MMILIEASGIVLAALFAMSAIGKAADPSASADMMRELGLPARWTDVAGRTLIFGELLIAAGLLDGPFRRGAADAALVLLIAFTVAVTVIAWPGKQVRCGCFGRSKEPQSGATIIARNLALGALAVLASHSADPAAVGWVIPTPIATGLGALGLAILVVIGLRAKTLGPQTDATPKTVVRDRDGGQLVVRRTVGDSTTLAQLAPTLPALVLFLDTDCPGCVALLDQPVPDRSGVDVVTLVVDSANARPDLQERSDVVVVAPETFTDAGVPGTPCGMLFGPDWQLLGEPLLGERAIGFALAAAAAT